MTWKDIPGWFDFQAVYDDAVSAAKDGDTLVEIGAWKGRSTAYMLDRIKASGKQLRFVVVDTFNGTDDHEIAQEIKAGVDVLATFLHNMRACGYHDGFDYTLKIMPSVLAATGFVSGEASFVFIDGDHDLVAEDIAAWLPKIKSGGVIAGHDYAQERVRRDVDSAFSGRVERVGSSWRVKL